MRRLDGHGDVAQHVVLVGRLVGPALHAAREVGGRVGRDLGAEEVERARAPEVEIFLHRRQIDGAMRADARRIVGAELLHHFQRALDHAADAGLADEHVVRLLREHESARAGEGIKCAFGKALQLVLAVAVGEVGEAEKREPIRHRLVEGGEDARLVRVA